MAPPAELVVEPEEELWPHRATGSRRIDSTGRIFRQTAHLFICN